MPGAGTPRRTLTPIAAVTAAALIFTILLLLVRLQFAPLESADHHAAAWLNGLVTGDAALVGVIKAVTWLGSGGVLWTVTGAAVVLLAIRRRWRPPVFPLVPGPADLF